MPSSNFYQQPPEPSNKKWLWILGGCGCLVVMAIIGVTLLSILITVAVPRYANVTRTAMGAVAVDTLQQLENAAAIYTADQEKTPVSFTAFVTHDSNKMTEEGSTLVLDLSSLGNKKGRPCEIQPDKIRCSGGKPDSRFPDLPGDVTYSFNQGPGTFSIYCDGGDPSPTGWNPEKCKIEK